MVGVGLRGGSMVCLFSWVRGVGRIGSWWRRTLVVSKVRIGIR